MPHPKLGEAPHKSVLLALILGLGIPAVGYPAADSSPHNLQSALSLACLDTPL